MKIEKEQRSFDFEEFKNQAIAETVSKSFEFHKISLELEVANNSALYF